MKKSTLTNPNFKLFGEITKFDEEQRMVYGIATNDAVDSQGDIIDMEATKKALPGYSEWRNIREMHGDSVAGTAPVLEVKKEGLYIGAHIVDDMAWKKVKTGTYKGFSIGGQVKTSMEEFNEETGETVNRITEYDLMEISLVDRPANPEAKISMFKRNNNEVDSMNKELKKEEAEAVEETVEEVEATVEEVAKEVSEDVEETEPVEEEAAEATEDEAEEAEEEASDEAKEDVSEDEAEDEDDSEEETEKSGAKPEEITLTKAEYDTLKAKANLAKKQEAVLDKMSKMVKAISVPDKKLVEKRSKEDIVKSELKDKSLGELSLMDGGFLK